MYRSHEVIYLLTSVFLQPELPPSDGLQTESLKYQVPSHSRNFSAVHIPNNISLTARST